MSEFNKKLDKEQIKTMQEAYALHGKIIEDIQRLGDLNMSMAFGVLEISDTMLEYRMSQRIQKACQTSKEQKPEQGKF